MALNSSVACVAATGDVTHSCTYLQVDTLVADLTEAIAAAAAAGTLIDNIDVDPDSIVVENGISISYDLQLFTKSHIIVNDREMWSRGFHWKAYFFFFVPEDDDSDAQTGKFELWHVGLHHT